MITSDPFHARVDTTVDPHNLRVVLTGRSPWAHTEQVLVPRFERRARAPGIFTTQDLLGEYEREFGCGVGRRCRQRIPVQLMASP